MIDYDRWLEGPRTRGTIGFRCQDEDCPEFDVPVEASGVSELGMFAMDDDDDATCSHCGKEMKQD